MLDSLGQASSNYTESIFTFYKPEQNINPAPNNIPNEEISLSTNTIVGKDTYNFCTIVGQEYIFKAVSLCTSLENNSGNFHIWICCIDDNAYSILSRMNLKYATIFPVKAFETEALSKIRQSRSKSEYCWTLKAPLIKYILSMDNVDSVVYCDGDIFFFSDPKSIFEEWGDYSIFMCPQRDLDWVQSLYGYYQAGLIGFKRDRNGIEALNYWSDKCIEWCYGYTDPNQERWGDQKYLDKLPLMFKNIKISENLGIDAAPWNIVYNNNFNISANNGSVYIESHKLVAFHFACIAIFNANEFDLWTFNYIPISKVIKNNIYRPYIENLRSSMDKVRTVSNIESLFNTSNAKEAKTYYNYSQLTLYMDQFDEFYNICTITSSQYLIRCITLYYSLRNKCTNFHLWICCLDDTSVSVLYKLGLDNITIIPVREIEDSALLNVKPYRNIDEYSWTLKAPLVLYLLDNRSLSSVIYCDSDIFFFEEPRILLEEWKNYSFFMCPQRDNYEFEKIHGSFQAGLLGFKRDKYSYDILNWWRNKCVEWCYSYSEPQNKRWGDQKYLDELPLLFQSIKIVNNLGVNAAPWNIIINNNYRVHKENNEVYIENDKLVAYHFGSLQIFSENQFDLWKLFPLPFNNNVISNIYIPYLQAVKNTFALMKNKYGNITEFFNPLNGQKLNNPYNY